MNACCLWLAIHVALYNYNQMLASGENPLHEIQNSWLENSIF